MACTCVGIKFPLHAATLKLKNPSIPPDEVRRISGGVLTLLYPVKLPHTRIFPFCCTLILSTIPLKPVVTPLALKVVSICPLLIIRTIPPFDMLLHCIKSPHSIIFPSSG
jgi:hypothetical protein